MKIKYLIITALMAVSIGVNAKEVVDSNSLSSYYSHVNRAELLICDSDYNAALVNYKKAFSFIETPFSFDLINAFKVAYLTGDSLDAKLYGEELSKRKIVLKSDWLVHDSLDHPNYYNYVTKDFDSLIYYTKADDVSFSAIFPLYLKDQEVRTSGASDEELISADSTNLSLLTNYLSEYGFPESKKSGSVYINNTVNYYASLILWHQRFSERPILDSLLLKEVKEGRLYAKSFEVNIMFRNNSVKDYGIRLWDVDLNTLPKDQINKINQNRQKLYLEPLADYLKKYEYMKHNEELYGCSVFAQFQLLPSELTPTESGVMYYKSLGK